MKDINSKSKAIKKFSIIILLLASLFSFSGIGAQEVPKVNVSLKLKIKDGDLKNSQITITKTGEPYKVIDPDKGVGMVDLPLGFEYTFKYTKEGYNTKIVIMDTHIPENREKGMFAKMISEVELEMLTGKLEDNYIQFVGKITYSEIKGDFDFEKESSIKKDSDQKTENLFQDPPTKGISHSNKQDGKKNKDVKTIQEDYKKFTIITISIDGKDCIYKKEEYGWGIFYYKDGKRITESTFLNETQ